VQSTSPRTTFTGIDAAYYRVKDLARARAFYVDVVGLTPALEVPGVVCEFTFPGGETFGLFQDPEGSFIEGHGVMLGVSDIKAAVADLMSRGVKFDDDGKIEESPICWMAFARDTEGNKFIVHQHKTA